MKKLALCILALVALALVSASLSLTSCDARADSADAGSLVIGSNDAAPFFVAQDLGSTGYQTVPNLPAGQLLQLSHPAHKLGVSFTQAGVDSGTLTDGGALQFTLTTPINGQLGDPPITGVEIRGVYLDLVGGTYDIKFATVGGDPSRAHWCTGQLSASSEVSFVGAAKNLIATTYGVSFQ